MTQNRDTSAAVRHLVYGELLAMLPIASYRQVQRFAANLALCRNRLHPSDMRQRTREIDRIMIRLIELRVTPDLGEAVAYRGLAKSEIERSLEEKFGDRLAAVAGFYFDRRWRLNLPEECGVYGYRSNEGNYTGILFQPANRIDYFFLLSSRERGGTSPVRLTDAERQFVERFKD